MVSEGVTPALDLLLRHDDVAGVRECGEERGRCALEDALDLGVAHDVDVVEHREAVHRGLCRGTLERVLDVVGDEGTTVLVLALLELDVAAQVERVRDAVVADRPVGGELGHDFGEVHGMHRFLCYMQREL